MPIARGALRRAIVPEAAHSTSRNESIRTAGRRILDNRFPYYGGPPVRIPLPPPAGHVPAVSGNAGFDSRFASVPLPVRGRTNFSEQMSSLLGVARTAPAIEDGVQLGGVKRPGVQTVRIAREAAETSGAVEEPRRR